jgi:hypothetical protein
MKRGGLNGGMIDVCGKKRNRVVVGWPAMRGYPKDGIYKKHSIADAVVF